MLMKNRNVGVVIIGVALLIGFMIWLFNRAFTEIVTASCAHGETCPMWGTIHFQTNLSLGIMSLILLLGIYFMFFAKDEEPVRETVHKHTVKVEDYSEILNKATEEEKKLLEHVIANQGTIFQSELVEKTDWGKVKVTRILDKLEGRGIIERRRRGMTNVVILKH